MKQRGLTFRVMLGLVLLVTLVGTTVAQEPDEGPNPRNICPHAGAEEATLASAVISNGTVSLGVNNLGYALHAGNGLRYLPTNGEVLWVGCYCEGWGAADATSGIQGWASIDNGGVNNVAPVSFVSTATTATSVTTVGGILRVTHDYHPSPVTPYLYQIDVTIENISAAPVDLRYTRDQDWDVPPTPFNEYVTIQGTAAEPAVLYADNNGFQIPGPLWSRSSLGAVGDFVDYGPKDQGSLFDFGFGTLAPGESKQFTTYYGAAGTEADALAAIASVGASVYSLGQPNVTGGPDLGQPNTFIFAYGTGASCDSDERTYTLDADFDEGTLVNVNHDDTHDQLQLNSEATPFEFIWVAASGRGTIVKIDTVTGAILGEYWSAPNGRGRDPSRTTVDNNGNVWAGNRAESSGGQGSVVHIGLQENGQCVDRNGNGVIETSSGPGDIRAWPNTGGADNNGGVSTAQDECIIHYVRTSGTAVRTIAVDANNDVWVGGLGNRVHQLHDGTTGAPIGSTFAYGGWGGYGGLIDANGVLWSASDGGGGLLRHDPAFNSFGFIGSPFSYGLGRDSSGNIWNSQWTYNVVYKISPAGGFLASYSTHGNGARGVAATADDNMWIANSNSNNVVRLRNDGVWLATIPVGSHPTGVAVDAAGKVWVTNYYSHDVMRIDPATNAVDLTVSLNYAGQTYPAYPYNYSDMTGATLIAPPGTGTWTVVRDSGIVGAQWREVSWNSLEPGDSSITVKVASSANGSTFGPEVAVSNGGDPYVNNGVQGRYLKVIVTFTRASTGESPILYDLTIATNQPPEIAADADEVTVDEGQTATNTGTVSDGEGDTVTLTASVGTVTNNGDGTWSWSFNTDDGPAESQTVPISATDGYGCVVTVEFDLTVNNVAPTATFNAPTYVIAGDNFDLSLTDPYDPSSADTDAGFEYDFDCGVGYDGWIPNDNDETCSPSPDEVGDRTVKGKIRDKDGGETEYTDTVTILPPSAATDSNLCYYDREPDIDGQQFRLIFTPDMQLWPAYKLPASNPGQFFYNVFYTGAGPATFNITIPEPFETQGAMPVHVYTDVSVTEVDGYKCFVPANEIYAGDLSGLSDLSDPSGFLYVTVHLDYGLKGTTGYVPNANSDALDAADEVTVLIPNFGDYTFAVSGSQSDSRTIQNSNDFKKIPGFGGLVTDGFGDPVAGAAVDITLDGAWLGEATTDDDGWYMFVYKHTGKPADYTVELQGYGLSETGTLKANHFAEVNFIVD